MIFFRKKAFFTFILRILDEMKRWFFWKTNAKGRKKVNKTNEKLNKYFVINSIKGSITPQFSDKKRKVPFKVSN